MDLEVLMDLFVCCRDRSVGQSQSRDMMVVGDIQLHYHYHSTSCQMLSKCCCLDQQQSLAHVVASTQLQDVAKLGKNQNAFFTKKIKSLFCIIWFSGQMLRNEIIKFNHNISLQKFACHFQQISMKPHRLPHILLYCPQLKCVSLLSLL